MCQGSAFVVLHEHMDAVKVARHRAVDLLCDSEHISAGSDLQRALERTRAQIFYNSTWIVCRCI